jgi:hypothetical protein
MTIAEWKTCMGDLVDGVERELRRTAPLKTKLALETFKCRLAMDPVARRRRPFERELEAFIQSTKGLQSAAERYIGRILPPALEAAAATLERARPYLTKTYQKGASNPQGGANGKQPSRSGRNRKSTAAASRRSP